MTAQEHEAFRNLFNSIQDIWYCKCNLVVPERIVEIRGLWKHLPERIAAAEKVLQRPVDTE